MSRPSDLPVRSRSVRYPVVIDPTLNRRGLKCPGQHRGEIPRLGTTALVAVVPVLLLVLCWRVVRGEVDTEGKRIVLREWDEEVLLHECIHALLTEGSFITYGGYAEAITRIVNTDEEALVQHVSHGLYEMGWRLDTEREPTDPRGIEAPSQFGSDAQ